MLLAGPPSARQNRHYMRHDHPKIEVLGTDRMGSHFTVAQKQELVPLEVAVMTSPVEFLEASRLQREEASAKAAASKPWMRSQDYPLRPGLFSERGNLGPTGPG